MGLLSLICDMEGRFRITGVEPQGPAVRQAWFVIPFVTSITPEKLISLRCAKWES